MTTLNVAFVSLCLIDWSCQYRSRTDQAESRDFVINLQKEKRKFGSNYVIYSLRPQINEYLRKLLDGVHAISQDVG